MLIHLEAQAMPLGGENCVSYLHVLTHNKTRKHRVDGEVS